MGECARKKEMGEEKQNTIFHSLLETWREERGFAHSVSAVLKFGHLFGWEEREGLRRRHDQQRED